MKKISVVLVGFALCIVLIACSNNGENTIPLSSKVPLDSKEIMNAKIVACRDESLLVIKLDGDSTDLYTISLNTPVIDNQQLIPGTVIDIGYDGYIQEIYPAIIANPDYIKVIKQDDDIIGLYKNVFIDLFEKDKGLNDNVDMIAFNLEKADNLSIAEKHALIYLLGNSTGIQTRLATYDELVAEKSISIENGFAEFEKGILFSLETSEITENKFKFTAEKWRSSLGAYVFYDCTATKNQSSWTYTIGSEMIS